MSRPARLNEVVWLVQSHDEELCDNDDLFRVSGEPELRSTARDENMLDSNDDDLFLSAPSQPKRTFCPANEVSSLAVAGLRDEELNLTGLSLHPANAVSFSRDFAQFSNLTFMGIFDTMKKLSDSYLDQSLMVQKNGNKIVFEAAATTPDGLTSCGDNASELKPRKKTAHKNPKKRGTRRKRKWTVKKSSTRLHLAGDNSIESDNTCDIIARWEEEEAELLGEHVSYSSHSPKVGPPNISQKKIRDYQTKLNTIGTYVECVDCRKWRYLANVQDPEILPEYWVCSMAPGPESGCSAESSFSSDMIEQGIDFVETRYTLGSVVLARVDGISCWWPAIIDIDIGEGKFFWTREESNVVSWYHVLFFNRLFGCVPQAWVRVENVACFNREEAVSINSSLECQDHLSLAITMAENAKSLKIIKRRKTYCSTGNMKRSLPWALDLDFASHVLIAN